MKKTLMIASGIAVLAGFVAIGGHLISGERIAAMMHPGHLLAATGLCVPGIPCGGQLITEPIPCVGTGFVWAEIKNASGGIVNFIFEPTPFMYYLPTHIGQWFVGNTNAICNCATSPHRAFSGPCSFFYGTNV